MSKQIEHTKKVRELAILHGYLDKTISELLDAVPLSALGYVDGELRYILKLDIDKISDALKS